MHTKPLIVNIQIKKTFFTDSADQGTPFLNKCGGLPMLHYYPIHYLLASKLLSSPVIAICFHINKLDISQYEPIMELR